MRIVTNLRSGHSARIAMVVAPTVAVVLGLTGVAARPMMSLREAEVSRVAAEERLKGCHDGQSRVEAFEDADGFGRLAEAVERIARLYPSETSELDTHGAVRIVAEARGLQLESIQVGELLDPGFLRLSDLVAMRRVEITGEGPLEALVDTTATLEALGFPATVLEVSISRPSPNSSTFSFFTTLGLFQTIPVPEGEESESEDQEP